MLAGEVDRHRGETTEHPIAHEAGFSREYFTGLQTGWHRGNLGLSQSNAGLDHGPGRPSQSNCDLVSGFRVFRVFRGFHSVRSPRRLRGDRAAPAHRWPAGKWQKASPSACQGWPRILPSQLARRMYPATAGRLHVYPHKHGSSSMSSICVFRPTQSSKIAAKMVAVLEGRSETTRDCPGASHAHPTTNNTLMKMLQIARNHAPGPRCAPVKARPQGKTLHIARHRTQLPCQRCFQGFFGGRGVFWPLLPTQLDRSYTTWTDLVTRRPPDVFDGSYRWINFGDDRVDCDKLGAWGAGMTPTRNFEGWAFAVVDRAVVLVAFSLCTA